MPMCLTTGFVNASEMTWSGRSTQATTSQVIDAYSIHNGTQSNESAVTIAALAKTALNLPMQKSTQRNVVGLCTRMAAMDPKQIGVLMLVRMRVDSIVGSSAYAAPYRTISNPAITEMSKRAPRLAVTM